MRMTGRFALVALAIFVVGRSLYGDAADEMFDRIAENWRWSHYWFGKTGIDDVYVEGKQISALIFWTKSESQPIHGLCSSELGACVAYSGVYLDPAGRRMQMAPNTRPRQAFRSFISSGFADSSHIIAVEGIKPSDFESAEKSITLPALDPPSSISRREVPAEAGKEGERIKRLFRCWGVESETKPNGCSGSLVFAYYGPRDPYWFVLRSCAAACDFKGEAVEMLRRGDRGWEITSAGFVDNPKEAERLKEQIEKAEMIRLPL